MLTRNNLFFNIYRKSITYDNNILQMIVKELVDGLFLPIF